MRRPAWSIPRRPRPGGASWNSWPPSGRNRTRPRPPDPQRPPLPAARFPLPGTISPSHAQEPAMPLPPAQRGMYFEEFAVGQKVTTAGRTVTEHDIVSFAGLSGDFNQIHTDSEYTPGTPFGQRI